MGKKYIIDLNPDCVEGEYLRIPARIAGEEQWLVTKAALTPYTEPDLEQVRKEAYQNGYETGYEDGYNEPGKNKQEAYQRGLNDAWEAASEIAVIPYDEMEKIFGATGWHIFMKCTASETIEKIRQYEQEQEEFHVGDEVEMKCDVRPAIYMQGTKGSDEIYLLFNDGSCGLHSKSEIERKTGRHFHEIATIFENMRGEQDG